MFAQAILYIGHCPTFEMTHENDKHSDPLSSQFYIYPKVKREVTALCVSIV